MKWKRTFPAFLNSAALVASGGVVGSASAEPVHANDQAAEAVAESLDLPQVIGVAAVPTQAGGSQVIDAAVNGVAVDVPSDPVSGITLDPIAGPAIQIELPNAKQVDDARIVEAGVVAYDNNDGSSTVPVVGADGSLQVLTTITGPSAPTTNAYPLSLPAGSSLEETEYGSVLVKGSGGRLVANVAAPWACDAQGRAVPTHYELRGSSIIQVVDHRAEGIAYPVTADPWWGWQFRISSTASNRAIALLNHGVGVAGIVSAICSGSIVGLPCGAAWVIAARILAIGGGVLGCCNARGRGIIVNMNWNGWLWCTSQ
ncbi:MAG: hypothetical protein ACOYEV_02025 [Candidatus Nanopelagicales bacterium]